MKRLTCLLLSFVLAATMLAGCGSQSANTAGENSTTQAETKEKVVVACWGNQMLDSYTPVSYTHLTLPTICSV